MSLIIVCGYGPAGRSCVKKLERETGNIVIIDRNPEKLRELAHPYVVGDATKEDILIKAGIEKAGVLVVTAGSDVVNAFITLAAKSINPSIKVFTTAERLESVDKLYKAGAEYVVPESSIGARELVNGALKYTKESAKIYLGNGMEVHAIKAYKTGSIYEVSRASGVDVIALRRKGKMLKPEGEYVKGDVLYLLGNSRQMAIVRKMLQKTE